LRGKITPGGGRGRVYVRMHRHRRPS